MGKKIYYLKEANGILDIKRIVALNASHNKNSIMKVMRENFHRNATVTMFSSNVAANSQMESNLVKNIFNLINCSVVLYSERMSQSKVFSNKKFSWIEIIFLLFFN